MIKGVIFDFDGVIIDSEPLRYKAYRKLFLDEFNVNLPDDYTNILGKRQRENIKSFLDMFELKGDVDKLIKKRRSILDEIFTKQESIIPIKGVLGFIKFLKKHKIKIAIASSSSLSYIKPILKYLKIDNLIDLIVCGEMVKKSKPEPDIFLLTVERLGLNKCECVIIEDSLNGLLAAKRAGIRCFAITTSFKEEDLRSADFIFNNFGQRKIFKKIA